MSFITGVLQQLPGCSIPDLCKRGIEQTESRLKNNSLSSSSVLWSLLNLARSVETDPVGYLTQLGRILPHLKKEEWQTQTGAWKTIGMSLTMIRYRFPSKIDTKTVKEILCAMDESLVEFEQRKEFYQTFLDCLRPIPLKLLSALLEGVNLIKFPDLKRDLWVTILKDIQENWPADQESQEALLRKVYRCVALSCGLWVQLGDTIWGIPSRILESGKVNPSKVIDLVLKNISGTRGLNQNKQQLWKKFFSIINLFISKSSEAKTYKEQMIHFLSSLDTVSPLREAWRQSALQDLKSILDSVEGAPIPSSPLLSSSVFSPPSVGESPSPVRPQSVNETSTSDPVEELPSSSQFPIEASTLDPVSASSPVLSPPSVGESPSPVRSQSVNWTSSMWLRLVTALNNIVNILFGWIFSLWSIFTAQWSLFGLIHSKVETGPVG